eukprot:2619762-Amphidinium_carterae.1
MDRCLHNHYLDPMLLALLHPLFKDTALLLALEITSLCAKGNLKTFDGRGCLVLCLLFCIAGVVHAGSA